METMETKVAFTNSHLLLPYLSEQQARDIVDAFFRFSAEIDIYAQIKPTERRDRRRRTMGLHSYASGGHTIQIFVDNIKEVFHEKGRIGGNFSPPSLEMAFAMVLVHELTHANQAHQHSEQEKFYTSKRYVTRPCEKEARATVDQNMSIISKLIDIEVPEQHDFGPVIPVEDELEEIVASFSELDLVEFSDLREELRSSKILTPSNLLKAVSSLEEMGVKVQKG